MPTLGKLEREHDLRRLWPNEARDFTPWLAQDENLRTLSEALGLTLTLERIEVEVGPYSADILARDDANAYVVVENQYGKTDHDHLGKLITYGSVLEAKTIVWIAEEFTEQHKKAIDWINEHTDEGLEFYLVALEVWKIDGSRPAVRFNVVCRPADPVRRIAKDQATGVLSDSRKMQLEFWTMFKERLLASKLLPSAQAARAQYWYDVALGRAGFTLSHTMNTYENRLGIRLYMANEVADLALPQLELSRAQIENEIGEKLLWNPHPDKRDKIVALVRDVDLSDRARWPEYCEWLLDKTKKFRSAFGPRVKSLKLNRGEPGPTPGGDAQ